MRIQWLAHAAFYIEGDGVRIITDPYECNDIINLPPITRNCDIVIRSSDDDEAHACLDTIPGDFEVVTATEIVEQGATVKGVKIESLGTTESLEHKENPRDNAMYRFSLEGVSVAHMGDVGNALTEAELSALKGVDVLLALVGGPPTIELADLKKAIEVIKPKIVIPMHFRIPGPRFFMLPVTEFTALFSDDMVVQHPSSFLEVSNDKLPTSTQIVVLKPTLFRE